MAKYHITTPDGKNLEIEGPDGASNDEVIAAAKAHLEKVSPGKYRTPVRGPDIAPKPQPKSEAQQLFEKQEAFRQKRTLSGGLFGDLTDSLYNGAASNFSDEISGGTRAIAKALTGDFDVGRNYRVGRDAERLGQAARADRSPTASLVGEITGAVFNPMRVTKGGKVAQIVGTGAMQGGLNAAGASSDLRSTPTDALEGGVLGAATGGALAAAGAGIRSGVQRLADTKAAAAPRVAYSYIADLLGKSGDDAAGVRSKIVDANAADVDMRVIDASPRMRALSLPAARNINISGSDDLINTAQQRIDDRMGAFSREVKRRLTTETGTDAHAFKKGVDASRKAMGEQDYPAVLNKNFVWNDELEDLVHKYPTNAMNEVGVEARRIIGDMRDPATRKVMSPKALGISFDAEGNVIFEKVPSMRAFDLMKRAFDSKIGQALKAGDNAAAKRYSEELGLFRNAVVRSNPEYAGVLAKQRDAFQQIEATELGQGILSRIKKEPRELMDDLTKWEQAGKMDEVRTGVASALLGKEVDNPFTVIRNMRAYLRSPEQRAVLEKVFGKEQLGNFNKWVNLQYNAGLADSLNATGRQSITSNAKAATQSTNEGIQDIVSHGLSGLAFGGATGLGSGIYRATRRINPHATDAVQDEIARILLSRGEDLEAGVAKAQAFDKARRARNHAYSIATAKGGQQITSGLVGD